MAWESQGNPCLWHDMMMMMMMPSIAHLSLKNYFLRSVNKEYSYFNYISQIFLGPIIEKLKAAIFELPEKENSWMIFICKIQ